MPPAGTPYTAGTQRPGTSQAGLPYLLALPLLWSSSTHTQWPLLVYLHGAGESGSDPMGLLSEGATGTPPMLAQATSKQLQSYIVVSPQTDIGWNGRRTAQRVIALIDELQKQPLGIDQNRVILTGVSMGGAGTWSVASLHPHRFSAIVPVCGAPPDSERWAQRLARKPIYVFHGANDVIMPVGFSDEAVRALRAAGATSLLQYNRIDEAPAPVGWPSFMGHAAWLPAYAEASPLWEWLRKQAPLSGTEQAPPVLPGSSNELSNL